MPTMTSIRFKCAKIKYDLDKRYSKHTYDETTNQSVSIFYLEIYLVCIQKTSLEWFSHKDVFAVKAENIMAAREMSYFSKI